MKTLLLVASYVIVSILFVITFIMPVYALTSLTSPGNSTSVTAKVGQFYLDITGYIAPFASVVLLYNNQPLRTTTTDANGYFSISNLLINKGFSRFCLDAVDVKRLGESTKCFSISPATGSVTMHELFLPPTIGLQANEINAGQNATVWGYSMPGAKVTIHLSDGQTFTTTADNTGYYQISAKIIQAGQYDLFADANFQNKNSLIPDNKVTLLALSTSEQLVKLGQNWLQKVVKFLLANPWILVLSLLPVLLLILFLIYKFKPDWSTAIDQQFHRIAIHIPFFPHRLHHWWFVGY